MLRNKESGSVSLCGGHIFRSPESNNMWCYNHRAVLFSFSLTFKGSDSSVSHASAVAASRGTAAGFFSYSVKKEVMALAAAGAGRASSSADCGLSSRRRLAAGSGDGWKALLAIPPHAASVGVSSPAVGVEAAVVVGAAVADAAVVGAAVVDAVGRVSALLLPAAALGWKKAAIPRGRGERVVTAAAGASTSTGS